MYPVFAIDFVTWTGTNKTSYHGTTGVDEMFIYIKKTAFRKPVNDSSSVNVPISDDYSRCY